MLINIVRLVRLTDLEKVVKAVISLTALIDRSEPKRRIYKAPSRNVRGLVAGKITKPKRQPKRRSKKMNAINQENFTKNVLTEEDRIINPEIFQIDVSDPTKGENLSAFNQQKILENKYHKHNMMPRLRQEVINSGLVDVIQDCGILDDGSVKLEMVIEAVVTLILHRRASVNVMVGLMMRFCEHQAQETADALDKMLEHRFFKFDAEKHQFVMRYDVPTDVRVEIDRYCNPLPMLVKPRKVVDNKQSGYLSFGYSILMRGNYHDKDVCLDHINRVNAVKLSLNKKMVETVKLHWRSLASQTDKEDFRSFQRRAKTFEKYIKVSDAVLEFMMEQGNEFYLTHRYDARGRCYPTGNIINYSGESHQKAVIEFAKKEKVNNEEDREL